MRLGLGWNRRTISVVLVALGLSTAPYAFAVGDYVRICESDEPCSDLNGDGSGGGTETDREFYWEKGTRADFNYSSMWVSGASNHEIDCVETEAPLDHGKDPAFTLEIDYTCNNSFGLKVAEPEIGLVTTGNQSPPPCSGDHCPAGLAVIPIYGEWAGNLNVTLSQNATIVDQGTVAFEEGPYGTLNVEFDTDRKADYNMTFRLYDDLGILQSEHTETVSVAKEAPTFQLEAAEYAYWNDESTWLWAVAATAIPKEEGCLRAVDDGGTVLAQNNLTDWESWSFHVGGGARETLRAAKLGPSCQPGTWAQNVTAEQVPFGS